jgi:hypothetical protein
MLDGPRIAPAKMLPDAVGLVASRVDTDLVAAVDAVTVDA